MGSSDTTVVSASRGDQHPLVTRHGFHEFLEVHPMEKKGVNFKELGDQRSTLWL